MKETKNRQQLQARIEEVANPADKKLNTKLTAFIQKAQEWEEKLCELSTNAQDLQGKVISDDKQFKDLEDKTEKQIQVFLTEAKDDIRSLEQKVPEKEDTANSVFEKNT